MNFLQNDSFFMNFKIPWFKEIRKWIVNKTQVAPSFGIGRHWGYMFPVNIFYNNSFALDADSVVEAAFGDFSWKTNPSSKS